MTRPTAAVGYWDEAAEMSVLGMLILAPVSALEATAPLRAEMFYLDSHRKLYRAIRRVLERGTEIDCLMVRDELQKAGELDCIGGTAYIISLESRLFSGFAVGPAVRRIISTWRGRRGMDICQRYQNRFDAQDDPAEALSAMQADVFDAMQDAPGAADPLVLHHTVPILNDFLNPSPDEGLRFGIEHLDSITGGMRPKQVTVVGARSGVGKSSLVCQVAANLCPEGIPVDIFSLEMSREDVLKRLWSIVSGVSYTAIYRKACKSAERECVKRAAMEVAEWPLRIHDDADLTLPQICALARLSARRNGMKVFCVDYAQIVTADGCDERQRVSAVSRTLTRVAKSESVHLLLLSQLRKVPAEMYARPPHIGDLRETGQLENDAHQVLLLHRAWEEDRGGISNNAEILIPKQRNGPTGTIPASFDPTTLTFGIAGNRQATASGARSMT